MRKLLVLSILGFQLFIVSCRPNAEQQATAQKHHDDSIAQTADPQQLVEKYFTEVNKFLASESPDITAITDLMSQSDFIKIEETGKILHYSLYKELLTKTANKIENAKLQNQQFGIIFKVTDYVKTFSDNKFIVQICKVLVKTSVLGGTVQESTFDETFIFGNENGSWKIYLEQQSEVKKELNEN